MRLRQQITKNYDIPKERARECQGQKSTETAINDT